MVLLLLMFVILYTVWSCVILASDDTNCWLCCSCVSCCMNSSPARNIVLTNCQYSLTSIPHTCTIISSCSGCGCGVGGGVVVVVAVNLVDVVGVVF